MNIDKPHDIIPHSEMQKLPLEKRLSYVPIQDNEAAFLKDKDEKFRENWLKKSFRKRMRNLQEYLENVTWFLWESQMKYSQLEEIVKELLEMIKSLDARLRIMENRNFLLTL